MYDDEYIVRQLMADELDDTLAIVENGDMDAEELRRRDDEKWLILNRILDTELRKPEEARNTDLIGDILDYLDAKGWS